MAHEDKPLEYQRRIVDTKLIAQRVELDYMRSPHWFRRWRTRLAWAAAVLSVAGIVPFLVGPARGRQVFANGPVSSAHAIFERDCSQCHTVAFSRVRDAACNQCHDGPPHPAKLFDKVSLKSAPACADCHVEHRGRTLLADVGNGNCTGCHAALDGRGTGVITVSRSVTAFSPGRHPDFPSPLRTDTRPLRLNHAVHMPAQPKTIRGIKLPMQCSDCHQTDRTSPKGDLLPVTFEQHCRSCHKRELEFDVYQLLGQESAPAPHTKDPATIHAYIVRAYQGLLVSRPEVVRKALGRDLQPVPNQTAWLERVVGDSERFLFDRKCNYCHQYKETVNGFPVVAKVNRIRGRYLETAAEGEPWFLRGEFSHRSHRAVQCSSCHRQALKSTKTMDVLVPRMESCNGCHGTSGTSLDRCSQCHLYHNKAKEADKDRRPVEQLIRGSAAFLPGPTAAEDGMVVAARDGRLSPVRVHP